MIKYFQRHRTSLSYRLLLSFVTFSFVLGLVFPPNLRAQSLPAGQAGVLNLPIPGSVVPTTSSFAPAMIKGINLYPDNPLKFDFIIDKGDTNFSDEDFKKESTKLIKYFLASLTVPEDQMWVNLSPYEKNRIVPEDFGKTEMGRDLLAQDYMLKQITASLMNPEADLGGEFWKRVYAKAKEKYGTTDIPMNTFNKIWIVPEKAVVYEHEKGAFVVKSHLKVMLEEDYLALEANKNSTKHGLGDVKKEDLKVVSGVQSQIIKDLLIPEIEKEVNEGKTFANLRQIYNSVILASWYKQALKQTLLGQVYVDQKKTKGVEAEDKTINEKIYNQYVESFKKGVYNYIKEDYDPQTQTVIPRKYFSGGEDLTTTPTITSVVPSIAPIDFAQLAVNPQKVSVDLASLSPDHAQLAQAIKLPPAAISFQVADLKWGKDGVKILEIQSGIGSAFEGFKKIYNEEMMDRVWRYLDSLGLKALLVQSDMSVMMGGPEFAKSRGQDALDETGGVLTIGQLLARALTKDEFKKKKDFKPDQLGTYSGVMVLHSTLHSPEQLEKIREQNPQLLELDAQGATEAYLGDKLLVNSLFKDDLQSARPKWKLVPKNFNPVEVAQQIRSEMPSATGKYVIKAIDGSRGRGFIAVEADQLEEELTRLSSQFKKGESIRQREKLERLRFPDGEDDAYEFWALNQTNPGLLIEELVNSKPVEVDGKPYDGTMRVVYVLTYDEIQGTKVKVLGSYWKLPTTPIGEGSLRDTILSRIHPEAATAAEKEPSAPVSAEDEQAVEEQLQKIIPKLYGQMLGADPNQTVNNLLFSNKKEEVAYGIYSLVRENNLSEEQVKRLTEIANLGDKFYDQYLADLVKNKFYQWNKYTNLNPIMNRLLQSSVREEMLSMFFRYSESYATQRRDIEEMVLESGTDINQITNPELKSRYAEFLNKNGRMGETELLTKFRSIFQENEFESQKTILRILLKRKTLFDEASDWVWSFLQEQDTQLFALWVSEYGQVRDKIGKTRVAQARQRTANAAEVLSETDKILDELPSDKLVRLLELVTFEQSTKRVGWYKELAKKAYTQNRDQRLVSIVKEADEYHDLVMDNFRGSRRAIDAYYGAGLLRDVLSASERAIESLTNPASRELFLDLMERITVDENYFNNFEENVRTEVWKSAGLEFPLGDLRSESIQPNGDRDVYILGEKIGTIKVDGKVVKSFDRIKGKKVLTNLTKQIAQRAGVLDEGDQPVRVWEEAKQKNRIVLGKIDELIEPLTRALSALPEDDNLPDNIQQAVITLLNSTGQGNFPLINNYREDGFIEYMHRQRSRIFGNDTSVASVFGILVAIWGGQDTADKRKTFSPQETQRIAMRILTVVENKLVARIPSSGQEMTYLGEWNKRKAHLKSLIVAVDKAQLANSNVGINENFAKGGIDLNPAILNTEIKRTGRGVIIPVPTGPMPELKTIEGFVPNIINVTPITNLQLFLGIANPTPSKEKPVEVSYRLNS